MQQVLTYEEPQLERQPTPLSAVDIEHEDFEWLRAYLQREVPQQPLESDAAPVVGRKHKTLHSSSSSEASTCDSPLHRSSIDDDDDDALSVGGQINAKRRKVGWTSTEDMVILASVRKLGTQWPRIAGQLPGRTPDAVRNRWHRLQKTHALGNGEEGDAALDALLVAAGMSTGGVPALPGGAFSPPQEEEADVARKTGSAHGRTMWTAEEDRLIEEGVRRFGCKWRQIATALPGRSDSSIRNRWMRLQREKSELRAGLNHAPLPPAGGGAPVDPRLAPGGPGGHAGGHAGGGLTGASAATGATEPAAPTPPAAKIFGHSTAPPAAAPPVSGLPASWAVQPAAASAAHIAQRLSSLPEAADETGASTVLAPPAAEPSAAARPSPPVDPGATRTAAEHGGSAPSVEPGGAVGIAALLAASGSAASGGGAAGADAAVRSAAGVSAAGAAGATPLGHGAPLHGFDLGCFMHAVTCATAEMSEAGAAHAEAAHAEDDDLHDLFEVCELGSAQLAAPAPLRAPSATPPPLASPPSASALDGGLEPPRCLGLASSLLTAMSALTLGAALLPAARAWAGR